MAVDFESLEACFRAHGDFSHLMDTGACMLAEHDATIIHAYPEWHAENARLREQADALADALAAVRTQLVDSVYGPFPGGDPRLFTPDYDDNTPEEIGAWKAACEEWERGIGEDRGPSCLTFGDGTAYTGGGFGMGVSQWKHEAVEIIIDPALRAYREASHE